MVDIRAIAEIWNVDTDGYRILGILNGNMVDIRAIAEIWNVDTDGYWILDGNMVEI